MTAVIYDYFEKGLKSKPNEKKNTQEVQLEEEEDTAKNSSINQQNLFYQCKHCKKFYSAAIISNANLHKHLKTHREVYEDYLSKSVASPRPKTSAQYRKLDSPNPRRKFLPGSPVSNQPRLDFGLVTMSPKYKKNSTIQSSRLLCLIKMFVRLMLPLSLIQSEAFRDFMKVFDPSFNVPAKETVKNTGLSRFIDTVDQKVRCLLDSIEWLNISMDGWSDVAVRCYNGYVAQGICNDWKLHTICIGFKYTPGRHLSSAIKKQYNDVVSNFNIIKKIFKIVCD